MIMNDKHDFTKKEINVTGRWIDYICKECGHIERVHTLRAPGIFRALNSLKGSRGRCPYQESNQRWSKTHD